MKTIVLVIVIIFLFWPCGAKEKDYFVLGEQGGDGEILYPTQIRQGPDGNIYIYDRMSVCIKVFSSQGDFLRKISGKGQGLGEIQRADGLSFNFTNDGKMLYFTEFLGGHRWITFLELTGKFHHVLKLKMEKIYGILRSIHLEDGTFLADISSSCQARAKKDYYLYRCPHTLVTISPNGEILSRILSTAHVRRISKISHGVLSL